jgi:hypothetical protein
LSIWGSVQWEFAIAPTQHAATGQVTQWVKKQFAAGGLLAEIYGDLLVRD